MKYWIEHHPYGSADPEIPITGPYASLGIAKEQGDLALETSDYTVSIVGGNSYNEAVGVVWKQRGTNWESQL